MRRGLRQRRRAGAGLGHDLKGSTLLLASVPAAPFPRSPKLPRPDAAFSMIELLVTVLIILILTTLYWSHNTSSRQRSLQSSCQRNLQMVYTAMDVFTAEHSDKFPTVTGARTSSEALDPLVPKYSSDTSIFICPGSKDANLL